MVFQGDHEEGLGYWRIRQRVDSGGQGREESV